MDIGTVADHAKNMGTQTQRACYLFYLFFYSSFVNPVPLTSCPYSFPPPLLPRMTCSRFETVALHSFPDHAMGILIIRNRHIAIIPFIFCVSMDFVLLLSIGILYCYITVSVYSSPLGNVLNNSQEVLLSQSLDALNMLTNILLPCKIFFGYPKTLFIGTHR